MSVYLLVKIFVINPRGEILLLQRSTTDDFRPGGWDIPGGSVDPGEDVNAAVARELQEEAGMTATDIRIVYVATEIEDRQIVTLLYEGFVSTDTVTLSPEHERHQWIEPRRLVEFEMPEKYAAAIQRTSLWRPTNV